MAVPTPDEMYLPVLLALENGRIATGQEIRAFVVQKMEISDEDAQRKRKDTTHTFLSANVNRACNCLYNMGVLEKVQWGQYRITQLGKGLLAHSPVDLRTTALHQNLLREFSAYVKKNADTDAVNRTNSSEHFRKGSSEIEGEECVVAKEIESTHSYAETEKMIVQMEQIVSEHIEKLSKELLREILNHGDIFFEHLVVKLLLSMGYGGPESDSGLVTPRSNDGGIDGIIQQDKLGFDQIYIQAKCWDPDRVVGRPEIQKFCGALKDVGASRGLFITTAQFSAPAKESATRQNIVLVNGNRLTRLMIEYGVGVTPIANYELKKVDTDFFNEDTE